MTTQRALVFGTIQLSMLLMLLLLPIKAFQTHDKETVNRHSEFCEFETFEAKCQEGEVIVMKNARYGRMRIGRCVEASLGFLGCSANVLELSDWKCSGRQECDIRIPDPDFDGTKPCYKELKMYLEASYSCLKVTKEDRGCTVLVNSGPKQVVSIGSPPASTALPSGCGTPSQPWLIQALPGQRISVTLLDFYPLPPTEDVSQSSAHDDRKDHLRPGGKTCPAQSHIRGLLIDKMAGTNATICGNVNKRDMIIYQSQGNILELYLSANKNPSSGMTSFSLTPSANKVHTTSAGYKHILQFESIGCADLRPPGDAWTDRNGNEIIIGCQSSSQTWHLYCQGHRWIGVIGNCTAGRAVARKEALLTNNEISKLPHALAIATVAGIAIALCLVIVCIGIVCFRRSSNDERMRELALKAALHYDNVESDDEIVQAYYTRRDTNETLQQPPSTAAYAHVWELPHPQSTDGDGDDDVTYTTPASLNQQQGCTSGREGYSSILLSAPGAPDALSDMARFGGYGPGTSSEDSRYFVLDKAVVKNISSDTNANIERLGIDETGVV